MRIRLITAADKALDVFDFERLARANAAARAFRLSRDRRRRRCDAPRQYHGLCELRPAGPPARRHPQHRHVGQPVRHDLGFAHRHRSGRQPARLSSGRRTRDGPRREVDEASPDPLHGFIDGCRRRHRRARRTDLVSALPDRSVGRDAGARAPRRGGRLSGARADGGPAGRLESRDACARRSRAIRAIARPAIRPSRTRLSGFITGKPMFDRPRHLGGHRPDADRHDLGLSQAAARHLAAETRRQGHRHARRRGTRRSSTAWTVSIVSNHGGPRRRQRPRVDRQPRGSGRGRPAAAFPSSSMAASAAARTSSRHSRSARTPSASGGRTSGASRRSGRKASRKCSILRQELLVAMRQAGTRNIAEISRSYIVDNRRA